MAAETRSNLHIQRPYEDESIEVHFIGDKVFNNYLELQVHTNPGYEICLIAHGKGIFKIEEIAYPMCVNSMFFTKPWYAHAGFPAESNPYRILYICFNFKEGCVLSDEWNAIKEGLDQINLKSAYDHFEIAPIHKRLMEELEKNSPFKTEMMSSLIKQFIILTLRNFQLEESSQPSANSDITYNSITKDIIQYINEHVYEVIELKDMSLELNYSVAYICKKFKKDTGFTIIEYYNFARLEVAKKMLLSTSETITDISERLSYKSIHHFSKAFKILYGYAPFYYRKKLSQQKDDCSRRQQEHRHKKDLFVSWTRSRALQYSIKVFRNMRLFFGDTVMWRHCLELVALGTEV